MAKSDTERGFRIGFAARYDRYAEEKLAEVYRVLVPLGEPFSIADKDDELNNKDANHEEECSDLCTGFLGSAEGAKYHCESNGVAHGICAEP